MRKPVNSKYNSKENLFLKFWISSLQIGLKNMYNELVVVTLIIIYERVFERCKFEKNSTDALQNTGTKINHRKVIMSV